jgi:DNA adenine methylase
MNAQGGFPAAHGDLRARPFLKWAGGKRQLLSELRAETRGAFLNYYEPFLGGGALYFDRREHGWGGRAVLNDVNVRLMRTYCAVRDHVEDVIRHLKRVKLDEQVYYKWRAQDVDGFKDDVRVAAWFIYLNKAGFNGLYRVNRKGEFNVPWGHNTTRAIFDAGHLRACSDALQRTNLMSDDFEEAVSTARRGDLVYFDPPYVPVSDSANFTAYTRDGFTYEDQERLRDCAKRLKRMGARVILSNADVPIVRELYRGFSVRRVEARRSVNSKATGRGPVGEVIIT